MKIAIVHDDFMQYGGAEKLISVMLEAFPEADIYTSVYDSKILKLLKVPESRVTASFMQKIPCKKLWYKYFFFLYPLAFESLSSLGQFDQYKVVISSTARFAHGVLTKPYTKHIAYINSPGRMWWEPEKYFSKAWQEKFFASFAKCLKLWDKTAMNRVDVLVANSKNVASKVEACYSRKADLVIYPCFESLKLRESLTKKEYFLVVTRLTPWKKVDIAVEAFLQKPTLGSLVVVGTGPDRARLKRLAGRAPNITFLSGLTNGELAGYYKKARALIVTQEEDFGITPLEAMIVGTPVIAYAKGGVLETVEAGKHGVFFERQTAKSLESALCKFSKMSFSQDNLHNQAKKFAKVRFQKEIIALVQKYV